MLIEEINSQIEKLEQQKKDIKSKQIEDFIKVQVKDFCQEKQFENSTHFGGYLDLVARQIRYILEQ